MPDQSFDLVVIGGGIVGLSVAMEMTRRFPRLRLLLLEKETKRALHIPGTGITDYALVSAKYAELILAQGGEIRTGSRVVGIHAGQQIIVETTSGPFGARFLVNCAGLYSDEICRMAGNHSGLQ